jgi:hypothetical protein
MYDLALMLDRRIDFVDVSKIPSTVSGFLALALVDLLKNSTLCETSLVIYLCITTPNK